MLLPSIEIVIYLVYNNLGACDDEPVIRLLVLFVHDPGHAIANGQNCSLDTCVRFDRVIERRKRTPIVKVQRKLSEQILIDRLKLWQDRRALK